MINRILETAEKFKNPVFVAFIDYEKAFYSIEHIAVFESLEKQGVKLEYINILKNTNGTAQIKIDNNGEKFKIATSAAGH